MMTRLTGLLLLAMLYRPSLAAPAGAPISGSIMETLLHIDGEGFTPPAQNRALQALLTRHPALTFFEACGVGDTGEIARQLERDPKLSTSWTSFGWSALHLAAFSGVPGAVQLLLDHGADLQARSRNKFKNTPLQVALLPGQLATTKLLLERGADPRVRQAHGFTPLHEAALLGRRDLVDLLLAAGTEINARADDGRTAVTEALRGKHPDLAEYLRTKGGRGAEITADLNASPKD
jgi:ankyrin repeat protein